MNELRLALKQQNYPVNVIEKGIDKAMKLRKEELRIVREKTNDNIITYVSTFNTYICINFHFSQPWICMYVT